ncbi:hypothetical protein BV25DRAFT_737771 [Artomyces pyxidatus]|uniref:Uncharacterized protein n=1 Tax=Artomyces pyxidatus TaxID=48021 RepID=A0ACB8SZM4_9AGAM|nr:hypothetical protein BV25DRAFT_737771 [Artomyces pyxidatus]
MDPILGPFLFDDESVRGRNRSRDHEQHFPSRGADDPDTFSPMPIPDNTFIVHTPPKLQYLNCRSFYPSPSSPLLKSSHLTFLQIWTDRPGVQILEILRQLPALETLGLDTPSYVPPLDNSALIALPHLREFHLSNEFDNSINLWRNLQLPQEAEVYIAFSTFWNWRLKTFPDSARIAQMAAEIEQTFRAHISAVVANGQSYKTIFIARPFSRLIGSVSGNSYFMLCDPTLDDAESSKQARLPPSLRLFLEDCGPTDSCGIPTISITSTLQFLPAWQNVLVLDCHWGAYKFDSAEEWLELSDVLGSVERINVGGRTARGFIQALHSTAESSSPFFPHLKAISFKKVKFFSSLEKPTSVMSNSSTPIFTIDMLSTDTLFTALLAALNLRVPLGTVSHLTMCKCDLAMEMVQFFRQCMRGDGLEWDGELEGTQWPRHYQW